MLTLLLFGLVVVLVLTVGLMFAAFFSVAFEPVLVPNDSQRFQEPRLKVKPIPVPPGLVLSRERVSSPISA